MEQPIMPKLKIPHQDVKVHQELAYYYKQAPLLLPLPAQRNRFVPEPRLPAWWQPYRLREPSIGMVQLREVLHWLQVQHWLPAPIMLEHPKEPVQAHQEQSLPLP